jgi:hypothetical protein
MYCTNCGAKVSKNAKVCGNCGQPHGAVVAREGPSARASRVPVSSATQPKTHRRLPSWIWVATIGVVILAAAGLWIGTREQVTSGEPNVIAGELLIYVFNSNSEPATMYAGTSSFLFYGWFTKEASSASEYPDQVQLKLYIDGEEWPDPMMYWSSVKEVGDQSGDGVADFQVEWRYPLHIGTNSPQQHQLDTGRHEVLLKISYLQPVQDGFDVDGNGELDIYQGTETYQRTVIVQ